MDIYAKENKEQEIEKETNIKIFTGQKEVPNKIKDQENKIQPPEIKKKKKTISKINY